MTIVVWRDSNTASKYWLKKFKEALHLFLCRHRCSAFELSKGITPTFLWKCVPLNVTSSYDEHFLFLMNSVYFKLRPYLKMKIPVLKCPELFPFCLNKSINQQPLKGHVKPWFYLDTFLEICLLMLPLKIKLNDKIFP